MKIADVTLNAAVEKRDRNYLVQISAPLGGDITVTCYRQVILVKDNKPYSTGGDNGEKQYILEKRLSEVLDRVITLPAQYGGHTLTAGQIALALEMLTDTIALENQ